MFRTIIKAAAGSAVGILLVTGCATTPVAHRLTSPVFYPPDRQNARLQFLTAFTRPEDIEPGQSALLTFATGAPPPKPRIAKPYGVELRDNKVFVCDTAANAIHVLDLTAHRWGFFTPGGEGRLRKPINIRVDSDGTRYVADSGRGQVLIFNSAGDFSATIGGINELRPTDVEVGTDRIYVTDLKGSCVRVHDKKTREFLFTIPRNAAEIVAHRAALAKARAEGSADAEEAKNDADGKAAKGEQPAAVVPAENNGELSSPTNLALGPDGSIYVSDAGFFCVKQFDAEGKFLRVVGRHGDSPGEFARNKGIAVDRANRLYVVDAAFENCQIFDEQGRLLLHFGEPDAALQTRLVLPAGIAVNYDSLAYFRPFVEAGFELEYVVLIASQYGDQKINAYGFLKRLQEKP